MGERWLKLINVGTVLKMIGGSRRLMVDSKDIRRAPNSDFSIFAVPPIANFLQLNLEMQITMDRENATSGATYGKCCLFG